MTNPGIGLPPEAVEALRETLDDESPLMLLLSDAAVAARRDYLPEAVRLHRELASWLFMDVALAASDETSDGSHADRDRRRSGWRAVAIVVEIAAELGTGVLALLGSGSIYSAAALIRQVVECEYQLLAFREDFELAMKFGDADDDQMRIEFSPKRMRTVLGFDVDEYGQHCSIGGHPRTRGAILLPQHRALRDAQGRRGAQINKLVEEVQWIEAANHLDRAWEATVKLLRQEHARFPDGVSRAVELLAYAESAKHRRSKADPTVDVDLALGLLTLARDEV